jgi:hypothetical protein
MNTNLVFIQSVFQNFTGTEVKTPISTTPRRGLMGSRPLGVDYMPQITERARRMKAAAAIREPLKVSLATDDRQQRLPGF